MARDLVSLKMFTLTLTTALLGLLFSSCSLGSKNDTNRRIADHAIAPLFLQRESLYDLHREVSEEQMRSTLFKLFEAARWAPSEYNAQPWKFIYGIHGTNQWQNLYESVVVRNQQWVSNAGALILVLSEKSLVKGKALTINSFDTGMAVAQLLLQAAELGFTGHPLRGFDHKKVRHDCNIPQNYTIEAMVAVGEKALKGHSNELFAKRDARTVQRKSVSEIAFEGTFK